MYPSSLPHTLRHPPRMPVSVKKTLLSGEPLPCNASAETSP